jgi:acetylornithine deacetylase
VSESAELLAELVAIDSVNPALADGAAGEGEVARFVASWLAAAGLDVAVEEVAPGRPNVAGRARGAGGGSTLLLLAHTDTVSAGTMERPHEPRVEGGRLYGRGAYDMKAGLAAAMLAAREAARLPLAGDVLVAAVVDEEVASIGAEALVRSISADAAIVTEPTELELVVAHKGFVGFEIETRGRAAHGSLPDVGVDAIARMGRVLVTLERLDDDLAARASHPLLGRGSLHASTIRGGQEFSSYPERCVLEAERRTLPGELPAAVESELRALIAGVPGGELRLRWTRQPLEIDAGHPFAAEVGGAIEAVTGRRPTIAGRGYWTDAALLAEAGIPTVVFGPGGEGAHAEVEWVALDDVDTVVTTLVEAARRVCG